MRPGFERLLPLDLHGKVHDDGEGVRHRAGAVLDEQRHDVVEHRTIFLVGHRRFLLGGVKHFQESLDDPPFQPGSRCVSSAQYVDSVADWRFPRPPASAARGSTALST
jgi:hypothetical protein